MVDLLLNLGVLLLGVTIRIMVEDSFHGLQAQSQSIVIEMWQHRIERINTKTATDCTLKAAQQDKFVLLFLES